MPKQPVVDMFAVTTSTLLRDPSIPTSLICLVLPKEVQIRSQWPSPTPFSPNTTFFVTAPGYINRTRSETKGEGMLDRRK